MKVLCHANNTLETRIVKGSQPFLQLIMNGTISSKFVYLNKAQLEVLLRELVSIHEKMDDY